MKILLFFGIVLIIAGVSLIGEDGSLITAALGAFFLWTAYRKSEKDAKSRSVKTASSAAEGSGSECVKRWIAWECPVFGALAVVCERAEANRETMMQLEKLELMALSEAKENAALIKTDDGGHTGSDGFDELSETDKETVIMSLAEMGMSYIGYDKDMSVLRFRLSAMSSSVMGCTVFGILNRIEMIYGKIEAFAPACALELQVPREIRNKLLLWESFISKLYPQLTVRDEVYEEPVYTLEYVKEYNGAEKECRPGSGSTYFDKSMEKWRFTVQLDDAGIWYLSVFIRSDGSFEKYSLDRESADDSHYEFRDEHGLRKKICRPGDENRYLAEVLIRYVKEYGGNSLVSVLRPFITAEYHFD